MTTVVIADDQPRVWGDDWESITPIESMKNSPTVPFVVAASVNWAAVINLSMALVDVLQPYGLRRELSRITAAYAAPQHPFWAFIGQITGRMLIRVARWCNDCEKVTVRVQSLSAARVVSGCPECTTEHTAVHPKRSTVHWTISECAALLDIFAASDN